VQTGDPDATLDGQHTLNATAPGVYLDVDFGYQGTGSISDFVWNDLDGDGVQDAGEGGIGGVTVWVDLNNDGVQDATEPSAITDANGQYLISGLPAGTYTVRASGAPISGATATYDADGAGTTNVASVTLSAGENRTDVDWGYQFAALSISKTSSAGGVVNPGDTINYTIIVRNNTASQQTGIAITDALPEGTTYVAQSTVANGFSISSVTVAQDAFPTNGNGNTGSGWTGGWVEVGEVDGFGSGDVQVTTNRLRVQDNDNGGEGAYREVNLSGYATASLNLDYETFGLNDADEDVWLSVSTNGGSSWTNLYTWDGPVANETGSLSNINLTPYIDNDTRIRFLTSSGMGNNSGLYADNIVITGETVTALTRDNVPGGANPDLVNGTPANLVVAGDGFALDPGQQMQVIFSVTVDNPVQQASIDNTASVVSTQQSAPQYASTIDRLPPSSLGDRVWLDRDNDGIQDAGEPGIGGVEVTLTMTYPDGAETFTTFTDAAGNYSFANLYLNEAFTTAGATFSLSFDAPPGASASPVGQGGDPAADSNGATTAPAPFYAGLNDITYDSGFTTQRLDLGDLPDVYATIFSPGPAHVVFPDADANNQPETSGGAPAVWLGTIVDVELDGAPSTFATDDGNDEDGLVIPSNLIPGAWNDFTVTVNASETGTEVNFGLWIDWNIADSIFFQPEHFYRGSGVTASPKAVTVPVFVPANFPSDGEIYVRVRAADAPLSFSNATGTLINGEVEDHYRKNTPTAVTLAAFNATVEGQAVRVTWETATELDNLGFNLYRSESPAGPWMKLNAELIAAQNPGAVFGASYEWLDSEVRPDTTVYYRLEDVDVSGVSTFHGPVSATVTGPTAVRIAEFGARGTAPAVFLLTLATLGGLAVERKRRRAA
jgi:uncharacterized repeat protein (TIGR01451 family)